MALFRARNCGKSAAALDKARSRNLISQKTRPGGPIGPIVRLTCLLGLHVQVYSSFFV